MGKDVSPKCLASIMGIGNDRLHAMMHGKLDKRFGCFGLEPQLKDAIKFQPIANYVLQTKCLIAIIRRI